MSSYCVNRRKNGSWRIFEQVYVTPTERKKKSVPVSAYQAMRINPEWTVEEVKKHISQLNAQRSLERNKIVGAARRVEANKRIESAYLPKEMVEAFEVELRKRSTQNKDLSHWRFVQYLIKELKIDPQDFADNQSNIYEYFQGKAISLSYAEKVLFILNKWGKFVSRKRRVYFEEVETPRGVEAQRIKRAQRKKKPNRGPSEVLTPKMLLKLKDKLPNLKQYNWLGASVWFGLRPEEIDLHRCETYEEDGVTILRVYQPKLSSIDEEKRWKPIPVLYPEQVEFLEPLLNGDVERPLNKIIKRETGMRVTGYAGRKGFCDLMMDLGQKFEDISVWMGHKSIQRTWNDYKNRQRVRFTKPKSKAS
jgi:hypothetical protein